MSKLEEYAKATIPFGKVDYFNRGRKDCPVEIDIEIRRKGTKTVKIDGENVKVDDGAELSICGAIWNHIHTDCYSCGQNLDTIRKYLKGNKLFDRIFELWSEYHLNGLNAGTRKQTKLLKEAGITDYDKAVEYLKKTGNYVDSLGPDEELSYECETATRDHYTYGHGWVLFKLPTEIILEVKNIIAQWQ